MKCQPPLGNIHKRNRVQWAKNYVSFTKDQWASVVFSDEKKVNFDGPDGLAYYWHDIRRDERIRMSRQVGGGSVMVWGAFSGKGRAELVVMRGMQDAKRYVKVLEESLLPFIGLHSGDIIFQQDNAPIHTAGLTRKWLETHQIRLMEWPARSSDLNPIENVWSFMVRHVYSQGRQFLTVDALEDAIFKAWTAVDKSLAVKLCLSMPKRCIAVLENRGLKTDF